MTVKLVEIYDTTGVGDKLKLREVFINPEYVVAIRPDEHIKFLIESRQVIEGLDPRQSFTKIFLNRSGPGSEVTVIGDSNSVQEKLFSSKRVLKG